MKTPPKVIEAIKSADPTEGVPALAKRLKVSVSTVKRYRAAGRKERREIARDVLERRIEQEMPNALDALGKALKIACAKMEEEQSPEWVRETRMTAIALLDRMGVERMKDPLEGRSDEELLAAVAERLGMVRR